MNDEAQGADIQRSLGRLEAALKGLREQSTRDHDASTQRSHEHQSSDDREFSEIRRNFESVDKRLASLEGLADTVDSHGDALVDLEERVSHREKRELVDDSATKTNLKWIRIVALFAFMIAAKVYWPEVAQLASGGLFK